MSYLQVPRLIFSGSFQSDVATINNFVKNYDTAEWRTSNGLYELTGNGGGWNPNGSGSWRLHDVKVERVYYADGTSCDNPEIDPIVGQPLTSGEERSAPKMVDLDPARFLTEIWGFRLDLGKDTGIGFSGDYKVTTYYDLWKRAKTGFADDMVCAAYHSTVKIDRWNNTTNSRFLRELAATAPGAVHPDKISIKFNVDSVQILKELPMYTFGRIAGAIGKFEAHEPHHFIDGRALYPVAAPSQPVQTAYANVTGNILHVDLGNSLPTVVSGGAQSDIDELGIAVLSPVEGTVLLGVVDYTPSKWYTHASGISSFQLNAHQLEIVANHPLALVLLSTGEVLLRENADGSFVAADTFVYRFNPGDQATAKIYAKSFGRPLPNRQLSVYHAPVPASASDNALTFPAVITTDAAGIAQLPMTAGDPGSPRHMIDGQIYDVFFQLDNPGPPPVEPPSRQLIYTRVFSGFQVPAKPTWMEHIHPIFLQYANLYPVMKPIVDLSNYASVVQRLHILKSVFKLPLSSPNYMPVTRDLSRAKQQMIQQWLENPLYMNLDSVDSLKLALQTAIELEHSTIPPYLTAMYSIKQGYNIEIYELIRGVVMEEMLHMSLVCNLLIAIGGSPDIAKPSFVPDYPGTLPGGLHAWLTVRLRKCSIEHIRDCFMTIEEPEKVVEIKAKAMYPQWPEHPNLYTVGWFYAEIKKALTNLNKAGKLTFGNEAKQVTDWGVPGQLNVINNLQDALNAIDLITDQGEGTSAKDPTNGEEELAHYYKFSEIVHGHHMIRKDGAFSFTGGKIPFDPDGVWPMADDPLPISYAKGSRAEILSTQFAHTYQGMLKGLHRTFNGEPALLPEVVGTMYTLSLLARQLMETPTGRNDGTTAGPAFQLPL
ncbi:ferritin-like domain-containing protein [Chitinophaga nivalis]|uniref:Ferritin-like protein n=1 Tax=Chitinophaga nivalis TaxID=2991709 RepID=A0ABT3IN78_9BACT|nr:ferritin-like protein [Chitinophaga nivalis]MCW3465063.1 ferritin-like protein [Chitinophaga nivalis]MCW3485245.1 ferritin-like protein [Chitinophaga nivalis]